MCIAFVVLVVLVVSIEFIVLIASMPSMASVVPVVPIAFVECCKEIPNVLYHQASSSSVTAALGIKHTA